MDRPASPSSHKAAPEPASELTAGSGDAGPPFRIGMIAFERMTNLDLVGPHDLLVRAPQARIHTLAKTLDPMVTDSGSIVVADTLLSEAPPLDMIFIGGGAGSTALMEDPEVIGFLKARGPEARWITSVCTGALVLGAAGLLRGYRATTHWMAMDVLPLLGAEPVRERVVIDRNRITGGGVTAGVDFALIVIEAVWGRPLAEAIQLGAEYDPQPPFGAGSPATAPAEVVAKVRKQLGGLTEARMAVAERVARSFA